LKRIGKQNFESYEVFDKYFGFRELFHHFSRKNFYPKKKLGKESGENFFSNLDSLNENLEIERARVKIFAEYNLGVKKKRKDIAPSEKKKKKLIFYFLKKKKRFFFFLKKKRKKIKNHKFLASFFHFPQIVEFGFVFFDFSLILKKCVL
jgi:hypothetical protein